MHLSDVPADLSTCLTSQSSKPISDRCHAGPRSIEAEPEATWRRPVFAHCRSVLLIGHPGQDALRDEMVEQVTGSPRSSWRLGWKHRTQLSAIEKRDDRLVSTMRKYVEALGGKLRLQAVFEGGKVLEISE